MTVVVMTTFMPGGEQALLSLSLSLSLSWNYFLWVEEIPYNKHYPLMNTTLFLICSHRGSLPAVHVSMPAAWHTGSVDHYPFTTASVSGLLLYLRKEPTHVFSLFSSDDDLLLM